MDGTAAIAGRVRAALSAADLAEFADLLDPKVRWGPPDDLSSGCHSRDEVLAWYRRGRADGVRSEVTEVLAAGDRILVGLQVVGRGDAEPVAEPRWQVLTVRDALIVEIVGFDDRDEAIDRAGPNLAVVPAS